MHALEDSQAFINRLLRSYILTFLKKYFVLPNSKDFSFTQNQAHQSTLKGTNLSIKQEFFSDNFLPFLIKYSQIDSLSIDVNHLEFLKFDITIKGVYLRLKLVEAADSDDELQKRLRWIGYLFKAASDIFNETGKRFLKRKLKAAVNDKIWNNIQVI